MFRFYPFTLGIMGIRSRINQMTDLYVLDVFEDDASAEIRFFSMNTLVRMQGWTNPDSGENGIAELKTALEKARLECLHYEGLFSRTIPSSDISHVNESDGYGVRVDDQTANLVKIACAYCERSGGAFDITIGALTTLWDFHTGYIPELEQIKDAKTHVDYKCIDVYEKDGASYIKLLDPKAKLDLGGIAKGWVADRLLELLMRGGLKAAIVDIGGNIVVDGSKQDGKLWRIGIKAPDTALGEEELLDIIELESGSVATSGVYERYFEKDGRTFHHILNPKTGYPLETCWKAVSVIADNALDAEGFSTTLLSMNIDQARELAARSPEIKQAFFIDEEHAVSALYPEAL